MRVMNRLWSIALLSVVAVVLAGMPVAAQTNEEPSADPAVLVFSKTAEFRHGSIPAGIAAIEELGAERGFTVDTTEDASAFTAENLARYDAVIWLSTTGDVLDEAQQAAFEDYIEAGGGYAGVHAASDTEYGWSWYGGLVGAYFAGHPENQTATVDVADSTHPSTSHLPARWERFDEWYNFQTNPRGAVHVLASLDESTYDAGSGGMGTDHPIAWCQYYNGGRSWYTGLGHTDESFDEPAFREHLAGGIEWAAGMVADDCGGTVWNNYQKIVLDADVASPMGLTVAEDGRVFYIERAGQVRVIDPETSVTSTAATIPVHTAQENGLLGIALDPDFAENGWVYLYYSPPSDAIDSPRQHLSRFTITDGTLDLASEEILLEIPHQRQTCCHSGGHLQFGPDGNLWISTGDDTSPSASDGFTPIDEREGREPYDAQRSSANTNDLRGKLLRITPTDEGGYTIPQGNLFDEAADTEDLTRPEIYGMGFRNPFRFTVDMETGWAYVADYGPDAGAADPERGSDGRVEWNIVDEPGNYGWPYCHGGAAFRDYDFATGESGEPFDCENPVNESPNNTGLTQLPPVLEPEVWYGRDTPHPEIGTGGAPMAGPRYQFDPTIESDRQWPDYFDGTALFYEWGQNDLYEFHLTDADPAEVYDITPLLSPMPFSRPHDMEFGPHDGALYMIEWGSGFGGDNPDAQVVRVDYSGGQVNPIARVSADPTSGSVPLTVAFSSAGTAHPQGGELTYHWEFGDGTTSDEPNPTHTYTEEGNYTAVLTVTDVQDRTGTANVTLSVGNTEPDVEITWPVDGGVFSYGDEIPYRVSVTDVEDGSTADGGIDCDDIVVEVILGHDDHGHPMEQLGGCEGTFVAEPDGGHTDLDRITYVLEARYTDRGSPDGEVAPMLGRDLSVLQPARMQAEHYDPDGDVRTEDTADPIGGGRNVGWIEDGSHLTFSDVNLFGIDAIDFRVASPNDTSRIEVRKDAVDGEVLGVAEVPQTGGFQSWEWVQAPIVDPGETFDLYLVFRGGGGYLLNLNLFDFVGEGVAAGPPADIPLPTAVLDPSDPDGADGWYTSPVTLSLQGNDDREYRLDLGDWVAYDEPVVFDSDGTYRLDYRAVRGEDVSPGETLTLAVDTTDPQTTIDLEGVVTDGTFTGEVEVTLDATDATSGVGETHWRLAGDAEHTVYDGPFVLDEDGNTTIEYRAVDVAGNAGAWQSVTYAPPSGTPPAVTIDYPPVGGVVPASGLVPFDVAVTGGAECDDMTVTVLAEHGDGRTAIGSATGCEGTVATALPAGLGIDDVESYVLRAAAVPGAGGEVVTLVEGVAERDLQPYRKQAEHTDSDVRTEQTGDSLGGGLNVGWIQNGFTMSFDDVNLTGIDGLRFRLASSSVGGTLEVRAGAPDGQLLGSVNITNTGGSQRYQWFETPVEDPGGTFSLYLVFTADGGHYIANINFLEFLGDGIAEGSQAEVPTVTATVDPAEPTGADGWYTAPVTVMITADDPAATLEVDTGDGWAASDGTVTLDGDGEHTVRYRATNGAGMSEEGSVTVRIDASAPTTTASVDGDGSIAATVTLDAADAGSGVAATEWRLVGGDASAYDGPISLDEPGTHTVEFRSTDVAGNVGAWQSVTVTVDEPQPCPEPDHDTVVIGGVDSGVANHVDEDGCSIADQIDDDGTWTSMGSFVRHVHDVAARLMADGVIGGRERGLLVRAAVRSRIGRLSPRR